MLLIQKMPIKRLGRAFCHSPMVQNSAAGDKGRIVLTLHGNFMVDIECWQ